MIMFRKNVYVKHVESGEIYQINREPDSRKLEATNNHFYEYRSIITDQVWLRDQHEMEDGRFGVHVMEYVGK